MLTSCRLQKRSLCTGVLMLYHRPFLSCRMMLQKRSLCTGVLIRRQRAHNPNHGKLQKRSLCTGVLIGPVGPEPFRAIPKRSASGSASRSFDTIFSGCVQLHCSHSALFTARSSLRAITFTLFLPNALTIANLSSLAPHASCMRCAARK